MKKIDSYIGCTKKSSGSGELKYCLWLDNEGGLFIQMLENSTSGEFSKHLFSVSKYISKIINNEILEPLVGFNVRTNEFIQVENNNNSSFLKAILTNLLPMGEQK